jgi:serine/threonine protein kinase
MELCQGGTLNEYLNANTLNEPSVKIILQHLLTGLEYLDNLSISHRDLKPENIFIAEVTIGGKSEAIFKIGDFGFAAQKQTFN